MALRVSLLHRTQYRYGKPVSLGPQIIQLRPAPHCRTPILSYSLRVSPNDRILNWQFDPHSNHLARTLFPSKTTEFTVEVELIADLTPINPFAFLLEPGFDTWPFVYRPELTGSLAPFLGTAPAGPRLKTFLNTISRDRQSTVAFLVALSQRVRDEVGYTTRMEAGVQSTEQTLTLRTGSCRDSAWLLVEVCRHLGIAARFASGYLIQLATDAPQSDPGAASVLEDSAALHAWTEVFLPGAGWVGMDPTSGLLAAEGHLPLVCTPNAEQAAPIDGSVEPSTVEFGFEMSVRRFDREQQFSQPYSDKEWNGVCQLARAIDSDLVAHDVRLTMGGEPTFVGIDEIESPQWHLEALGALKRTRGLALIRNLREKIAPGGVLHFGQGKWYPGEALPRWAFHCISRKDGVAIWEDLHWIPLEDAPADNTSADALTFLQALCRRLQVTTQNLLPAFNPDSLEDGPAGYVLPLRRRQPHGQLAWSSQLWFPRPERLLLTPGDSPIGYRIPVEVMPLGRSRRACPRA